MKVKISFLALTALLILGLSISNALAGSYVTYLGKSTWTATINDDTNPAKIGFTFTVTGGISKVGDEFYQFQGYATVGTDGPFVMSGSGFLMGTNLVFTLSESQQHADTWRDRGVMQVSLDKSTLSGTFYDIGQDFDTASTSRVFDQRFTAGTITLSGKSITIP